MYFGDAHAQVYALDAGTGALKWKVKVEEHLDAMITGGVVFHDGRLYVPVSSLEEGTATWPSYECCTFRGSVRRARRRQREATVEDIHHPAVPRSRLGRTVLELNCTRRRERPCGRHRHSIPERNRLYITTGDSYSSPAAPESDAIMALAMDTGRVLWTRQTLPGDAWNTGCFGSNPAEKVNCPVRSRP